MKRIFGNNHGEIHTTKSDDSGDGVELLHIKHSHCTGTLSLQGGHVLQWQPAKGAPVFWLSDRSAYQQGLSIRGGVPICWPWFGDWGDKPVHGFASLHPWRLQAIEMDHRAAVIALTLSGKGLVAHWPHAFELHLRISLGAVFEQRLTFINTSRTSWSFSAAFHNYLALSDTKHCTLPQLSGLEFEDKLADYQRSRAPIEPGFNRCVDRIYTTPSHQTIEDQGTGRRLTLSKFGCPQWVLWNPGADRVHKFPDIHDGGERQFICLEAAKTVAEVLAPGQQYELGQRIAVDHL